MSRRFGGAGMRRGLRTGAITVGGAPVVAPTNLAYATNPATYTEDEAIATNTPTWDGSGGTFTVDPALPDGLSLNASTGAITGTPTTATALAVYTVTLTNSAGSDDVDVTITVEAAAGDPMDLLPWFERWRADTGITIATGVSVWEGMIGARTFTAPGASNTQPSLQATITELNNQPAVRFDGTNDALISSDTAATWNLLHNGGPVEVWVVMVPRVAANRVIIANRTSTAAGVRGFCLDTTTTGTTVRMQISNGTAAVVNATGGAVASGTGTYVYGYYEEGRSGNEYAVAADGSAAVTGNSSNAPSALDGTATLSIGCFGNSTGFNQVDIAEVMIFDAVLTTDERNDVIAYMASQYGL